MGLLDEIAGKAAGLMGGSSGGQTDLMGGIMEMLTSQGSGGLSSLVKSFQEKGMGDIISSWISTGPNQSISADQIREGLGSDTLQNLAAKAGFSQEEIGTRLAETLPGVIDSLTPDGAIPDGGLLAKGLEFLKGKMG
jgi:uncharacterized protein YidB (DUF937 family)